jgi:hypothetical protein
MKLYEQGKTPEVFSYGSTWLKADFYLHTNADQEFFYMDDVNIIPLIMLKA